MTQHSEKDSAFSVRTCSLWLKPREEDLHRQEAMEETELFCDSTFTEANWHQKWLELRYVIFTP